MFVGRANASSNPLQSLRAASQKNKPGCPNLLGECDEAAEDMVDDEESVGDSSEDSANDSAGSSEEFDVMPQGEASQQANDESVAASIILKTIKGRIWINKEGFGLHQDAWKKLFDAVDPGAVVVVKPFCLQGGILLAALAYNDSKVSIGQCPLFAFCNADSKKDPGKISRISHMNHHVFAMVTASYKNFRMQQKSSQRRSLLRRNSGAQGDTAGANGSNAYQHALSNDTTPRYFFNRAG